MADFGDAVKNIWIKGMEAIGKRASDIASNTKSKVDEMNMVNRRAEILKDFGARAYALWQKGEQFPDELTSQLKELSELDEKLNDIRAERYANVQSEKESVPTADEVKEEDEASKPADDSAEETDISECEQPDDDLPEEMIEKDESATETEQDAEAEEETARPVILVEKEEAEEETNQDLNDTINELFQKSSTAEVAAEKINTTLDSLENELKEFSDGMDEKISQLTDQITGNQDK